MDMNVYETWLFSFTLLESIVIVIGNGFLLITFLRHRKLLNALNCYIFSMCLSGLITGFLAPFGFGNHIGPYTVTAPFLSNCETQKGKACIFYATSCNSILCMLAIAVERWRALSPSTNQLMINRRRVLPSAATGSKLVASICWIISIGYAGAYLLVVDYEEMPVQYLGSGTNTCYLSNQTACGDFNFCYLKDRETIQKAKLYHLLTLIIIFLLPLFIISIIYVVLVSRLLRNAKLSEDANRGSCSIHRAKLRAIRAMILVVVVFAVCWLPGHILLIWLIMGDPPQVQPGAPIHVFPLTFRVISDAVVRLIVTHHWIQVFIYPRYSRQLANAIKETATSYFTACSNLFSRPCRKSHDSEGNAVAISSSKNGGTTDSRKVSINPAATAGVTDGSL